MSMFYVKIVLAVVAFGWLCAGFGYVWGYGHGRLSGFNHGVDAYGRVLRYAFRKAGKIDEFMAVMEAFAKNATDEVYKKILYGKG